MRMTATSIAIAPVSAASVAAMATRQMTIRMICQPTLADTVSVGAGTKTTTMLEPTATDVPATMICNSTGSRRGLQWAARLLLHLARLCLAAATAAQVPASHIGSGLASTRQPYALASGSATGTLSFAACALRPASCSSVTAPACAHFTEHACSRAMHLQKVSLSTSSSNMYQTS